MKKRLILFKSLGILILKVSLSIRFSQINKINTVLDPIKKYFATFRGFSNESTPIKKTVKTKRNPKVKDMTFLVLAEASITFIAL